MIGAISYRPFEGERSVYVIEAADAMAEESQNALLKTLEEPPPYAHLLLITSEPEALLETVRSRCQAGSPSRRCRVSVVERRLGERSDLAARGRSRRSRRSPTATSTGPASSVSERGTRLRELTERCCRAARAGRLERTALDRAARARGRGRQGAGEPRSRPRPPRGPRSSARVATPTASAARAPTPPSAPSAARGPPRSTSRSRSAAAWFTDLARLRRGGRRAGPQRRSRRRAGRADAEGLDPVAARRGRGAARWRPGGGSRSTSTRSWRWKLSSTGPPHPWTRADRCSKKVGEMSALSPPELPSTAERPAIQPVTSKRPFGVRLWLALMFAAIGILTGTSVYLFVSESSESAAEDTRDPDRPGPGARPRQRSRRRARENAGRVVARYRSDAFAAWVFDAERRPDDRAPNVAGDGRRRARRRARAGAGAAPAALSGRRYLAEGEDGSVVVALPIFRDDDLGVDGAVLVQADAADGGHRRAWRRCAASGSPRSGSPCWSPRSSASSSPA